MGKFANTFDMKLADLTADVETKIGVFFIKNPQLEKVTFKKPTSGTLGFTAKICHINKAYYYYFGLDNFGKDNPYIKCNKDNKSITFNLFEPKLKKES